MATRYAHVNIIAKDWRNLCDFYETVFDCEPWSSERDHHGSHIDALTGIPGAHVQGRHLRVPGHGENGPTIEIFTFNINNENFPKPLNRPGLALTGFVELFTFDQVQLLGNHELEYLRSLPRPIRRAALDVIYQFPMPCVVVTGSGRLLPELRQMANLHGIPMLRSEFNTAKFTHLMHFYLDAMSLVKPTQLNSNRKN